MVIFHSYVSLPEGNRHCPGATNQQPDHPTWCQEPQALALCWLQLASLRQTVQGAKGLSRDPGGGWIGSKSAPETPTKFWHFFRYFVFCRALAIFWMDHLSFSSDKGGPMLQWLFQDSAEVSRVWPLANTKVLSQWEAGYNTCICMCCWI
jgi:hypothetical protein